VDYSAQDSRQQFALVVHEIAEPDLELYEADGLSK